MLLSSRADTEKKFPEELRQILKVKCLSVAQHRMTGTGSTQTYVEDMFHFPQETFVSRTGFQELHSSYKGQRNRKGIV